jgi:hypothetical protein
MPEQQAIGPLPLAIPDITGEFLAAALSARFPGIAIRDFRIEEVHRGFSTVLRLHLDVDDASRAAGVPPTIIFKGGFEEFTRAKAGDYSVFPFKWEVDSYTKLKPKLGLNMPDCYFAEFDPERRQMTILIEDLAARKVTFGHGLKPQTPEQVKRRLTSLADMHAQTWGSLELEPGGDWNFLPPNGARMFLAYMEHAGYTAEEWRERYITRPRGAACSVKFHDYDWLMRALHYMADLCDRLPNCAVHGDTHLGNLYEEADGTPGFFDSLARREPGMFEVTYHICNALDPMDRRRSDRELVAHYREELARRGVEVPSLDDMLYQFAVFLPNVYVTFIVNESAYQTEAFNTAHASRANVAMLDHGTYELIDAASPRMAVR